MAKVRMRYGARYLRRDGQVTHPVRKTRRQDSEYWKTHPYYASAPNGAWECYTEDGQRAHNYNAACAKHDLIEEVKNGRGD